LRCIIILNVLLHASQVYEFVHLTEVTNMLLWLMFFLWLPILTLVLILVQLLQFVYLPKNAYQVEENKGCGFM